MLIKAVTIGVLLAFVGVGCSGSTTQKIEEAARGGRGESCQARNDCADGLACVKNICSQNDFAIQVTAKQCVKVECQVKDDCCRDMVVSSYCTSLKTQCDTDPTACPQYTATCTCQMDCKDSKCVTSSVCTTDTDCFSSAGSFCVGGQCVMCKADTDCGSGSGSHCVAGTCKAGCTKNEECPFFNACQGGQCVETGCQSDRECYGATTNPLARCHDKKCVVPCENDGECGDFEACSQGACVFVGCETDDQCRYFLGIQSQTRVSAVCR